MVFMCYGVSYTLSNPGLGLAQVALLCSTVVQYSPQDRGVSPTALMIGGTATLLVAYTPLCPGFPLAGPGWAAASLAVQGIGAAGVYIGSYFAMLAGVAAAGLPDTEQVARSAVVFIV